jgi:6-phosphogluconolactonase (cycloisomerase 2 family)
VAAFADDRLGQSIPALCIDRLCGAVSLRRWQTTLGTTPRFLTLSAEGSFLIGANEGSDTVVRWRIGSNGSLEDGRVRSWPGTASRERRLPGRSTWRSAFRR